MQEIPTRIAGNAVLEFPESQKLLLSAILKLDFIVIKLFAGETSNFISKLKSLSASVKDSVQNFEKQINNLLDNTNEINDKINEFAIKMLDLYCKVTQSIIDKCHKINENNISYIDNKIIHEIDNVFSNYNNLNTKVDILIKKLNTISTSIQPTFKNNNKVHI